MIKQMKTSYKEIKSFRPCVTGWELLLENTNPGMDMEKEINLMDILKSNGIKDAIWALRCFDYMDWCLFIREVAESVLPLFEKKYPKDDRPRKALQAIRDYKAGKITKQDLSAAAAAAYVAAATYVAADAAAYVAAEAAYAAYAAAYAANAAYAAANAAYAAAAAAADAAYVAAGAAYTVYAGAARDKKWEDIEQIFVKHFGEKK